MASYSSGQQTRAQLIDAAGELAAQLGFSKVSLRAVAQKAGQNTGCIHYHFKAKQKLFEAVIRAATKDFREKSYSSILTKFDGKLHNPEVQAQAIRAIVHRTISVTFNPDNPWWYCQVLYQTMQAKDHLMELLFEEIIIPDMECLKDFFKQIKPELDDREAFLHTWLMKAPIIFHADNAPNIFTFLEMNHYDQEYLQKMEDLIVLQTRFLLGLPTEDKAL